MSINVCIANRKGGTGKTSVAVNLAATLADFGWRVLLVDLDSQGHCSLGLGMEYQSRKGVHRLFKGESVCLAEVVQSTPYDGLDLLPADIRYDGLPSSHDKKQLKHLLEQQAVENHYHWVIMDTPPSQDIALMNGLVAADTVLVPMIADSLAQAGVRQFTQLFFEMAMYENRNLKLMGIIPVMSNPQMPKHQAVMEQVERVYGADKILTRIPRDNALPESFHLGVPLIHSAEKSFASRAFIELAQSLQDQWLWRKDLNKRE